MIAKKPIVSLEEFPGELFLVIGLQEEIHGESNIFVLMSSDKKTMFRHISLFTEVPGATIEDFLFSNSKNESFCYRCLEHVTSNYELSVSEYYNDIDDLPVHGVLPHCPECGNEVYSKAYHTASIDYKNYLQIKGDHFTHEV